MLSRGTLNFSSSTEQLKEFAAIQAATCGRIRARKHSAETALSQCEELVKSFGLPSVSRKKLGPDLSPALNRYCDEQWWLKNIFKERRRVLEQLRRLLLDVHRSASAYCSLETTNRHRQKKKQQRLYLESKTMVNSSGESFLLADIADKTVSNPAIRRAEFMTRIKGFEMVAQFLGHVAEFYTLTCPSKYHRIRGNNSPNENYNKTTPREANQYLGHVFQLIRSELNRQGIRIYGVRVSEPHHDGTPHWHLLAFIEPQHLQTVRKVFKHYSLLEDGNEKGAKKYRFKSVPIDPSKGSATGYVAKYVSKNIDGAHLENDLYGNAADSAALHIEAWARTWGIRQFNFFGGPSVTVYRELRKIREAQDKAFEEARRSADAGDWAAYVLAMGGPNLPRNSRPLKPAYQLQIETGETIDRETGEISPATTTRYGDIRRPKLEGVLAGIKFLRTRNHDWQIVDTSTVTAGADGAEAGGPKLPRRQHRSSGSRTDQTLSHAPQALSDLCQ